MSALVLHAIQYIERPDCCTAVKLDVDFVDKMDGMFCCLETAVNEFCSLVVSCKLPDCTDLGCCMLHPLAGCN